MPYIFEQGHLDGLCSTYSIVNSISYMKGFTKTQCKNLFREVYAMAADISPSVTINGLYFNQMEQLLAGVDVPGVKITMPFRTMKIDSIDTFYTAVAERINNKPACAIIGLGTPMHHWTVAEHVHPRSLSLIDSSGRKQIKLSHSGLTVEKGKVRIHPRQTVVFEQD